MTDHPDKRKRVEGRSKWDRYGPAIRAANEQRQQDDEPQEKSAGEVAYSMASEIVRLLNRAIDEETDPERREHLKQALVQAHAGEDEIARALEIEARTKRLT